MQEGYQQGLKPSSFSILYGPVKEAAENSVFEGYGLQAVHTDLE